MIYFLHFELLLIKVDIYFIICHVDNKLINVIRKTNILSFLLQTVRFSKIVGNTVCNTTSNADILHLKSSLVDGV